MAAGFIRIGEERFKETSISGYKYDGQSVTTKCWYITIWFSRRERKFSFETEEECLSVVRYLDRTLGVREV